MPRFRTLLWAGAAGAAIEYLFDPQLGRTRRAKALDMMGGRVRDAGRKIDRAKRFGSAEMQGLQRRMEHAVRGDRPPIDDVALKDKIESNVFADPRMPKGHVNIDVADGIVSIRGQADSETRLRGIERAVKRIGGVRAVHNLMHVAGKPAPNKEDALRASSRAANELGRAGRST